MTIYVHFMIFHIRYMYLKGFKRTNIGRPIYMYDNVKRLKILRI